MADKKAPPVEKAGWLANQRIARASNPKQMLQTKLRASEHWNKALEQIAHSMRAELTHQRQVQRKLKADLTAANNQLREYHQRNRGLRMHRDTLLNALTTAQEDNFNLAERLENPRIQHETVNGYDDMPPSPAEHEFMNYLNDRHKKPATRRTRKATAEGELA
jgi:chromosome segregation ATPase